VYDRGVSDEVLVLQKPAEHSLEELADLARPGLERAGVERAVAFGSFARGTADGFSDLDLTVVIETELPFTERGMLLAEVVEALPVGVDLLVYTPEEYKRGMRERRGTFDRIATEGVTIYERSE
jgi:predicted nucleotidyltransferase